jgi:hypothetical protein
MFLSAFSFTFFSLKHLSGTWRRLQRLFGFQGRSSQSGGHFAQHIDVVEPAAVCNCWGWRKQKRNAPRPFAAITW